MTAKLIRAELKKNSTPKTAKIYLRFFKTGIGEYGEGDKFIGLTVPQLRAIAKEFKDISLLEVEKLLHDPIHEHRLTALYIIVSQFKNGNEKIRRKVISLYKKNLKYVNNWDLVDISAHHLFGEYLQNKDRKILYTYAKSKNLWKRRVAIISTFGFIRKNDFKDTLRISEILLQDEHDLIHKAVGWMLREVGKRDLASEEKFLRKNFKIMPRTMLRYAIEKFPDKKRKFYMRK